MEPLRFFPFFAVLLVPFTLVADEPEPEIISAWHQETKPIRTVRAKVDLVSYDDVFGIQRHAAGEVGYIGPRHGFWRIVSATPTEPKPRLDRWGVPYRIEPFDAEHWRWYDNRFREIDDQTKSFAEYAVDPSTGSFLRLFGVDLFRSVDWVTPFLPGRPNKSISRQWTYSVTRQTETHVWVRAVPKPDTPLHQSLEAIDLYFQRTPVRLLATRSFDGHEKCVLTYSDVAFGPEPWAEPDLSDYTQTNRRMKQAKSQ